MRPYALAALLLACTAEPSPVGGVEDFGATRGTGTPSMPEPSEEESPGPRPDVGAGDPEPTPTDEPDPVDPDPPGPDPVTPDPGCDDQTFSLFSACTGLQYRENPPPLEVGACSVLVDDPCTYQNCSADAWVDHHQQQVDNVSLCADRYPACESVSGLDRYVCMKGCYTAQLACARARVAECVSCSEVAAACTAEC